MGLRIEGTIKSIGRGSVEIEVDSLFLGKAVLNWREASDEAERSVERTGLKTEPFIG